MILVPQYRAIRQASNVDLLSNLILSLDLEEASGNAIDSSGNSYDFADTNTVTQAAGQTGGYNSREFTAANSEYFSRAASTTELTIGNNEWAAHMWLYNNATISGQVFFAKGNSTAPSTLNSRSFALFCENGVTNTLAFAVGLDPAASGQASAITPSGEFPDTSWTSVLIWHDPAADEIGIKTGSNAAVTASITTGVRNGTLSVNIGSHSNPGGYVNGRVAALRIWRGSGVIAQIVDNTAAIDFLNAQQRRHSELT